MPEPTLNRYLDELASGSPVPGGGAAAAVQVAIGAALVSMSCNLTIGRDGFERHEEALVAIRDRSESLRRRAMELAHEDAFAYSTVGDAYALPKETDAERSERAERIQRTLEGATEVPLDTMSAAARTLVLCRELVRFANPSVAIDVGVAAVAARAGLEAAALAVKTNLGLLTDDEFKAAAWDRMQKALETLPVAGDVLAEVEAALR